MAPRKLIRQTGSNTEGRVSIRRASSDYGGDEKAPFERFEDLTSKLLKVPKQEVDEKRAERKEARKRKQD